MMWPVGVTGRHGCPEERPSPVDRLGQGRPHLTSIWGWLRVRASHLIGLSMHEQQRPAGGSANRVWPTCLVIA